MAASPLSTVLTTLPPSRAWPARIVSFALAVTFLDIGPRFLAPDGSMPAELMPDGTHPSELGYAIWSRAITESGLLP
jgi:lysophospholipase L1-like esterase